MFIVKDGYIYVASMLILAVVANLLWGLYWAVIPLVLALYFAYFFRDEHRILPNNPNVLYAAADAHVMAVEEVFEDEYLMCECYKITTFLSIFDVHVNRSPMAGEVKYQKYTEGKFVPAYYKSATFKNERFAIGIDNGQNKILVIQVAGLLCHRIINWVQLGQNLLQGERYGMIKFGSSTELYVPKDIFEPCVKRGDRVIGGITEMGRMKQ